MKNQIRRRKSSIKQQLNVLIQLAKVDRDYDQKEKDLIRELSKKFGIRPNELREIEQNPQYIGDLRVFTMDEKIELLYNVVKLAKADRRIMPNEVIYCQEIASKLGFKRSAVQAMLPLVNDQPIEFVHYTSIRHKIASYL